MSNNSGGEGGLAATWFQFFLDAGVPPSDAGNYAVTFTENRIQSDMMTDLTKEYLADMGITVLGDVIAILKHARVVHTKTVRENALRSTGLVQPPSTSNPTAGASNILSSSAVLTVSTASSQMPAPSTKAMLSKSSGQANITKLSAKTSDVKTSAVGARTSSLPSSRQSVTASTTVRPASVKPSKEPVYTVRKNASGAAKMNRLQTPVVSANDVEDEQQDVSDNIVVSVSNTKRVLQQPSEAAGKKSSVFDRLGSEVKPADSPLTVTVCNVPDAKVSQSPVQPQTKMSSIFSRLGGKQAILHPLLMEEGSGDECNETSTLCSATVRMAVADSKKTLTARLGLCHAEKGTVAPKVHTEGILGSGSSPTSAPIRLRLGAARSAENSSTAVQSSVRHQLGVKRVAAGSVTDERAAKVQAVTKQTSSLRSKDLPSTKLRLGTKQSTASPLDGKSTKVRLSAAETSSGVKRVSTTAINLKPVNKDIRTRLGPPNTEVSSTTETRPADSRTSSQIVRLKRSGVFDRLGSAA